MQITVVVVVATVLLLRLMHLSSSAVSPLTYQLGADEDYYFRFARAVLMGRDGNAEFLFMDPLYGYIVAAVFSLVGPSVFAVFALQCVLDTATAIALLLIGREIGKPTVGVMAALAYGLTSTALMFTGALLKEVWVAAFMSWWVFCALKVAGSSQRRLWFAFGVYSGLGVALRSTAVLLVLGGLLLPLLGAPKTFKRWRVCAGLLSTAAALAIAPWVLRNLHADDSLSPLPYNTGIVLHQAYNAENPASAIWIPPFVNYLNPREIWRGYAAEAERRAGHSLKAHEIDAFWKANALGYITGHPAAVLAAIGAKARKFFAATDTPINRSLQEEAIFSPLIRYLPPATPWLVSLGLVGLVTFSRVDRRWVILCMPVAVSFVTVALFWAEDRFRYHSMPILALGAALLVEYVATSIKRRAARNATIAAGGAAILLATSFALARDIAPVPLHWDQIVWGYIKMNNPREATLIAERVVREQPGDGAMWEAVGYLAVLRQDFVAAEGAYRRAIAARPSSDLAHFDLAKVLGRRGLRSEALDEANRALALREDPDYRQLAQALK